MFLVLKKDKKRITSLVIGVHGDTMDDLKLYAKEKFKYDEALEVSDSEHDKILSADALSAGVKQDNKPQDEYVSLDERVSVLENMMISLEESEDE